jgi:hypothetical protein
LLDLGLRHFSAEHWGEEPLTQAERHELAELELRFQPDPNDPLKESIEAWGAAPPTG